MRQRKDGSTSLSILVPGDGVTPGTNEQPISLGMLTGKLTHGTGQLQGFREDRRNLAKTGMNEQMNRIFQVTSGSKYVRVLIRFYELAKWKSLVCQ